MEREAQPNPIRPTAIFFESLLDALALNTSDAYRQEVREFANRPEVKAEAIIPTDTNYLERCKFVISMWARQRKADLECTDNCYEEFMSDFKAYLDEHRQDYADLPADVIRAISIKPIFSAAEFSFLASRVGNNHPISEKQEQAFFSRLGLEKID